MDSWKIPFSWPWNCLQNRKKGHPSPAWVFCPAPAGVWTDGEICPLCNAAPILTILLCMAAKCYNGKAQKGGVGDTIGVKNELVNPTIIQPLPICLVQFWILFLGHTKGTESKWDGMLWIGNFWCVCRPPPDSAISAWQHYFILREIFAVRLTCEHIL